MASITPEPIALTVPNAVAYSGLSRSKLYQLIRSRDVTSVQVGGRRLVLRSGIDDFFARLSEGAK